MNQNAGPQDSPGPFPNIRAINPVSQHGIRRILIADDEHLCRQMLSFALKNQSYEIFEAESAEKALEITRTIPLDAVLLDIHLPVKGGEAVLAELRAGFPHLSVIVLTGDHDQDLALRCLKGGAVDFLTKPCEGARLLTTLSNAIHTRDLEHWLREVSDQMAPEHCYGPLFGRTPAIRQLFQQLRVLEDSDASVCLLGEIGTGKEWAARAMHERGNRKNKAFVSVNCGSLPASILESVLFDTKENAAAGVQVNAFAQAAGGTLYLGNIERLSPELQARLEKTLRRHDNIRYVSSSFSDLTPLVRAGQFNPELYYRLATFNLYVPPLRERLDDVPDLAERFLLEFAVRHGKRGLRIGQEASNLLCVYHWPGNLAELRDCVERAVMVAQGAMILSGDLPGRFRNLDGALSNPAIPMPHSGIFLGPRAEPKSDLKKEEERIIRFEEEERQILQRALELTRGDVTTAALKLGIGRATLYRRIKELKLKYPH